MKRKVLRAAFALILAGAMVVTVVVDPINEFVFGQGLLSLVVPFGVCLLLLLAGLFWERYGKPGGSWNDMYLVLIILLGLALAMGVLIWLIENP